MDTPRVLAFVILSILVGLSTGQCPQGCDVCPNPSACDPLGCAAFFVFADPLCQVTGCYTEDNYVYEGGTELGSTITDSKLDCCAACEVDAKCEKWSWHINDKTCFLKGSNTKSRTLNAEYSSGLSPSTRPCTRNPPNCPADEQCWETWLTGFGYIAGCRPVTGSLTPTQTRTNTPTPTLHSTITDTSTGVTTMSHTLSSTQTVTPSHTISRTPTPTLTDSHSSTASPVSTPTPSTTPAESLATTPTHTNSGTQDATKSTTVSATRTHTKTPTVSQSVTPAVTRSHTVTDSQSPTATPSSTNSITSTATASTTLTGTTTSTTTSSHTMSTTPTISPDATHTPTPSSTSTQTRTLTSTASRSQTPTSSTTPKGTLTPSPTHTLSKPATMTGSPSTTQHMTLSATPSALWTYSRTLTPTQTVSETPSLSETPSSTVTITPTYTVSPSYTLTTTSSVTSAPSRSVTSTVTPSSTKTSTTSVSATPSVTETDTISATVSILPTSTPTPTTVPTLTLTITPSFTVTLTPTWTPSMTASISDTITLTMTTSNTHTSTVSPSYTLTSTLSVTDSPTRSVSATPLGTLTAIPTHTPSPTRTGTVSTTPTPFTLTPILQGAPGAQGYINTESDALLPLLLFLLMGVLLSTLTILFCCLFKRHCYSDMKSKLGVQDRPPRKTMSPIPKTASADTSAGPSDAARFQVAKLKSKEPMPDWTPQQYRQEEWTSPENVARMAKQALASQQISPSRTGLSRVETDQATSVIQALSNEIYHSESERMVRRKEWEKQVLDEKEMHLRDSLKRAESTDKVAIREEEMLSKQISEGKQQQRERKEREVRELHERKHIEDEFLKVVRMETEQFATERAEQAQLESLGRLESERLGKERLERERLRKELLENERLERESIEKERISKLEQERIAKLEVERAMKVQKEKYRIARQTLQDEEAYSRMEVDIEEHHEWNVIQTAQELDNEDIESRRIARAELKILRSADQKVETQMRQRNVSPHPRSKTPVREQQVLGSNSQDQAYLDSERPNLSARDCRLSGSQSSAGGTNASTTISIDGVSGLNSTSTPQHATISRPTVRSTPNSYGIPTTVSETTTPQMFNLTMQSSPGGMIPTPPKTANPLGSPSPIERQPNPPVQRPFHPQIPGIHGFENPLEALIPPSLSPSTSPQNSQPNKKRILTPSNRPNGHITTSHPTTGIKYIQGKKRSGERVASVDESRVYQRPIPSAGRPLHPLALPNISNSHLQAMDVDVDTRLKAIKSEAWMDIADHHHHDNDHNCPFTDPYDCPFNETINDYGSGGADELD